MVEPVLAARRRVSDRALRRSSTKMRRAPKMAVPLLRRKPSGDAPGFSPSTIVGVLFYLGIVAAGASLYECPFQTPACNPLRTSWVEVRPRLVPILLPVVTALRILGVTIQHYIFCIATHFHKLSDRIQPVFFRVGLRLLQTGSSISRHLRQPPLPTFQYVPHRSSSQQLTPWFTLNELAMVQAANVDDARCVSWVLRNITDPEALYAAIRLAETIQWFEDGIDTCPPYDLIVSAFHACFGSNREVYPGLRDRAYHAGRAILWIHTLAVCKSEEFARTFPLPTIQYTAPAADCDLTHILGVNAETSTSLHFAHLLHTDKRHTSLHLQWISNILLHLSWATQPPENFTFVRNLMSDMRDVNTPLDVTLNHFLMCCNFLGAPIKGEALKIQDKSYDICHEIRFLGLISCFHFPIFSFWTYYLDLFAYGLPFSFPLSY